MIKSVIIVGGGLVGVASAYALAKRGISVDLVEARDGVALDTSYANGGMLTPSMPDPWNGPGVWRHLARSLVNPDSAMLLRRQEILRLAPWGVRFLANSRKDRHAGSTAANFILCEHSTRLTRMWRDEEGLEFASSEKPTIKFFRSEAAMAGPLKIAESLRGLGLRFQTLDRRDTIALEPTLAQIADQIAGAIVYPDDAQGDAHLFTSALASRFEKLGGRVRLGQKVSGLVIKGDRVVGVGLAHNEIVNADAVLICAASATARLTRTVGVIPRICPAKGYSLTFDLGKYVEGPEHPVVDDGMHAAVVPLGSKLRVAGTAEFAGENRTIDPHRIENLRRLLHEVYPRISAEIGRQSGEAWTGLRPMSADGRPYIGETRYQNLWLNAGHGHLGWTMAAGSADLLAALMTRSKPPIDPTPYRACRA